MSNTTNQNQRPTSKATQKKQKMRKTKFLKIVIALETILVLMLIVISAKLILEKQQNEDYKTLYQDQLETTEVLYDEYEKIYSEKIELEKELMELYD